MKSYQILAFTAFLSLSACTEEIHPDLNTGEFQRLVVEGLLTTETKAHKVSLSLTSDYFDNETPPPAEGATVTISDGTNTFSLSENTPGNYFTDENMTGQIGTAYTLKIEWKGETYTAVSTLKDVAPIIKVEAEEDTEAEPDEDTGRKFYDLLLYSNEPEGLGDNYFWRAFPADDPDNPERTFWEVAPDDFVDGNVIDGASILYIEAEPGETFVFEQYGIGKEAFDFFLSIQQETIYKGGIFDSPPANITGNVDKGALGFFLTSEVSRDTVLIE